MFEGKMLREAIGTPMRMKERAKSRFAEADPDPFTLANLTTKSFVRSRRAGIRRYLSPLPSGRGGGAGAGGGARPAANETQRPGGDSSGRGLPLPPAPLPLGRGGTFTPGMS